MEFIDNQEKVVSLLILVKTYPVISKTYQEVVCTAGVDECGNWHRIFPIPYRYLNNDEKFRKYDIIKIKIKKAELATDRRKESYKILDFNNIDIIKNLGTENNWQERKDFLSKLSIYENKQEILDKNKNNELSLCRFKPKKIIDFIYEEVKREYSQDKIEGLVNNTKQEKLFEGQHPLTIKEIKEIKKLPYKFSYKFIDNNDVESTLMIEDWEIGALYWNLSKNYKDEKIICDKVKSKYLKYANQEEYALELFLGTTKEHDGSYKKSKNPFIIVGIFTPKANKQIENKQIELF
jgi:hypothetical protein